MSTSSSGSCCVSRSYLCSFWIFCTFFYLGFRAEAKNFIATLVRSVFLLLILYVFYRMWTIASVSTYKPYQLVWYLTLTELVAISAPIIRNDIEREVNDGSYALILQKPLNYGSMKIAEGAGRACVNLSILLAVGGGAAAVFTGAVPEVFQNPVGILVAAGLTIGATVVSTIYLCAIGLSAAFIRDTGPLWWVWQKSGFVLGGLMVPLVLYPEWMQQLAKITPFYYIFFGVGRIVLDESLASVASTSIGIATWGLIGALLVNILQRRIENDIIAEGG